MKYLILLGLLKTALSVTDPVCLGKAITCAEIMVPEICDSQLWGRTVTGIDFTKTGYNKDIGVKDTLQWVGCPSDGCAPSQFYCTDLPTGIEFGSNSGTLRSLWGNYATNAEWPQAYQSCAQSSDPWSVHNAPMEDVSGMELCRELGYVTGEVIEKVISNTCPEPEYDVDVSGWDADFVNTAGYGKRYRCTTGCDGPAVSVPPDSIPIDNVCELLDVDFFLAECSVNHNNLVSNLGNNQVNDEALTIRVNTLEQSVADGAASLQTEIDNVQTRIDDLVTTIRDMFNDFVTSLNSLSAPMAKSVPILNEDGKVIGQQTLFFTTLQAQWLLVLLIVFNLFLFGGIGMYFCMSTLMTPVKNQKPRRTYSHVDTSDSESSAFSN